jgi:hypothetical protein
MLEDKLEGKLDREDLRSLKILSRNQSPNFKNSWPSHTVFGVAISHVLKHVVRLTKPFEGRFNVLRASRL